MAPRLVVIITAIVLILLAEARPTTAEQCNGKWEEGCRNKVESLKLKVIAIFSILVTSVIGVSLPLFSRSVPALRPDRDLFVIVKAFASGVILATGYMHVLPDSFQDLTSECLPERPWRKFPFTTFIAMFSAVITLVVDSYSISFFKKKLAASSANASGSASLEAGERKEVEVCGHGHGHDVHADADADRDANIVDAEQLLRYRVVAQVSYLFNIRTNGSFNLKKFQMK